MKNLIEKLFTVKNIITIMLTTVFSVLSLRGTVSGDQFLVIFTTITAFYFGTQHDNKGGR